MGKNRRFVITDYEADEGNGPTKVTFDLIDPAIEAPEGNREEYDIGVILQDLITAAGFHMGLEEVTSEQATKTDNVTHGLKGTSSGVAQDFYQGG